MAFVKEYFGNKPIIGAEIGVFKGEHACEILRKMPNVEKLYLVDPYEAYNGFNPRSIEQVLQGPADAQNRFDSVGIDPSRYEWVIAHFSASVVPEELDFIYIDGNHAYKAVKFDILEARKIVKIGGILGGHDYRLSDSVSRAVDDSYRKNLQFEDRDWWVIHGREDCYIY